MSHKPRISSINDHFDTPRRVAKEDYTIIWDWESKPFGEDKPTGSYTLNLRFPGQYYDAETEHHYNIIGTIIRLQEDIFKVTLLGLMVG